MFLKCYVFSHTHTSPTLASTELLLELLQYQARLPLGVLPPLLHTCWMYPASAVISQTSPSVGTHTPITCLGCATPAAPPPPCNPSQCAPLAGHSERTFASPLPPALPRTFERFFLCRSKTALVRTLVLCRLSLESQTSPNRIFFVNIRFRFEPTLAPGRLSIFVARNSIGLNSRPL